mgnify:CR=1 FL=1|tara:strand:+ start:1119 stop:1358 length:240 start_codon:yes stop_codon:yes gene_type:complete
MATEYRLLQIVTDIYHKGRKISFAKLARQKYEEQQAKLKDAYEWGLTKYVEKVETKPKKKEGVLKDPLTSKKKKDEKEL